MVGMAGQMAAHVVRRSVEQYPGIMEGDFSTMSPPPEYKLELSNLTMFSVIAIVIVTCLIIVSVDYTVGSIIAALTVIESPSSTAIVESAPPAYSDEPDAPLEKKDVSHDIEVMIIENKPTTARIITAVRHLNTVGGFFARWRGLFQNFLYLAVASAIAHGCAILLRPLGHTAAQTIGYTLAIVASARLHMLWTHSMIAMPSNVRWYKRMATRKQSKAVLLPVLVYGVASQATLVMPIVVAHLTGLFDAMHSKQSMDEVKSMSEQEVVLLVFRIVAVPVTYLAMALYVYLPAKATLIKVEACLLPEDQKTIVPFDREAIMGDIDLSQRGASKKLFRAAWRSFDGAARTRLANVYVKLFAFQFAVLLVGLHLIIGVLYVTSREQMVKTLELVAN